MFLDVATPSFRGPTTRRLPCPPYVFNALSSASRYVPNDGLRVSLSLCHDLPRLLSDSPLLYDACVPSIGDRRRPGRSPPPSQLTSPSVTPRQLTRHGSRPTSRLRRRTPAWITVKASPSRSFQNILENALFGLLGWSFVAWVPCTLVRRT